MTSAKMLVTVLVTSALLLVATLAWSRPGGGSSFHSSSSSSSSSSGSAFRSTSSSSSSSSGGSRSSSSSSSSSGSSFHSTSSSSSSSSSGGGSTSSSSGFVPIPVPYSGTSSDPSYSYNNGTSSSPSSPSSGPSIFRALLVVFVLVGLVVLVVIVVHRSRARAEWDTAAAAQADELRATRHANVQAALLAIRSVDDAFSEVLFEDFLYALYAEVHTHRGNQKLGQLAAYLSDAARTVLGQYPAKEVFAIVIGGMRMESIATDASGILVEVIFTSNLSEKDEHGQTRAYYMEERWTLRRAARARSRAPEAARVIGCPSCGAPLEKMIGATCSYCNATTSTAAKDWFVETIEVGSREERGPMLTGTTEEEGTDLPTVVARDANIQLEQLRRRDPSFQWPAFMKRIEQVFVAFHHSWVEQDLREVRPYLSDGLFDLEVYWVNAYKAQRLRNITKNPHIVTVHLAMVGHDKYFDSITVRVFASCVDYTVDHDGKLVGGHEDQARDYSEYWTFIRGSGKTGTPRADGVCPSCGGPLAGITMAGTCSQCNAKVTSGEFDWVLSRIEQDEVYARVA